MEGKRLMLLTAGLYLMVLMLPPELHAEPWYQFPWLCRRDCPRPSYNRGYLWTPEVCRVYNARRAPRVPSYPPDRYPGIAPTFAYFAYPCPPVDPSDTMYGGRRVGDIGCHPETPPVGAAAPAANSRQQEQPSGESVTTP